MKKLLLIVFLISGLFWMAKAQLSNRQFDTVQFNKQLELANQLTENEFCTQTAIGKFSKMEDVSVIEWFSYRHNNAWYTVGGNVSGDKLKIIHHVAFDSLYTMSDYTGTYDTSGLNAYGLALSLANSQFQSIRDTTSIYFNSFVINNPEQTISIYYFPAFQPSGQALYGWEWEYIFDKTGKILLSRNAYTNILTGVWIGQPRELWLNYRNTDKPTPGSIFFALSFRDYFTRIRIDTRISTSTTTKDSIGNYSWSHKMK
jgi:hypothetical protein